MNLIKICNKVIEYSFYALFFFVPLVLASDTSELFEFNKMWLTFIIAIIIAAAWISKMIVHRQIRVQKTPLDLPILLFVLFQTIATFHSLDTHISIWGYYSRFNGGLLSTLTYVFLYYAFVSNMLAPKQIVKRILAISLISAAVVALWGLPSHFGYDPTCLLFRGTLDVSCWTDAFQPRSRMFSTLGQPDWLAAYLAILLPIAIAKFILNLKPQETTHQNYTVSGIKYKVSSKNFILATVYFILAALFYVDLTWTDSRSGFAAFWVSIAVFFVLTFFQKSLRNFRKPFGVVLILFVVISFFIRTPIGQLDSFTFHGLTNRFAKPTSTPPTQTVPGQNPAPKPVGELGGTDSGKIRSIVWRGALDAWRANPFFGTGVETFAFAYYKYRPVEHNLTSEWDYLYNKAHNEFLNYLTTTGIFGLGTYVLMIGWFLLFALKAIILKHEFRILPAALVASYISILITNFLGFSVVITNIYLFLIPAFVLIFLEKLDPKQIVSFGKSYDDKAVANVSIVQWAAMFFVVIIAFFEIIMLIRFWQADKAYALGYNLDRLSQYQQGFGKLAEAVDLRGDEPVFEDELSLNKATLGTAFLSQKIATESAAQFVKEAIDVNTRLVSEHSSNVLFWKSRVRLFYTLSTVNPKFLPFALEAIEKAHVLAPTDAKISYNLGVLYGQANQSEKAAQILEQTIKLKPDYRDAYFALVLMYHDLAIDKNNRVVKPEIEQKAVVTLHYILENINPNDTQAKDTLKAWGEK